MDQPTPPNFEDVPVFILCGGQGTRLRPVVADIPKALAEVQGKPFLHYLFTWLATAGVRRVVLGVGHLREHIAHFVSQNEFGLEVTMSHETTPLGTGGALRQAAPLLGKHFIVMNGDSFCAVNLRDLYAFHLGKNALATFVLARLHDVRDYGSIVVNEEQRIQSFKEKSPVSAPGYVSGGIYAMKNDIFLYMPATSSFSLEYDVFPRMLAARCFGFPIEGEMIDIGTPERYSKAHTVLATINPSFFS